MSPRELNSTPPVSAADRIGALPDSILHHVLSFLPAQAAVQTCVLARRWRHLWRSTTGLRIVDLDDEDRIQFQRFRKFVDHLLILRERTDLDSVQIELPNSLDDDIQPYVNLWIRFAVMFKVRVLALLISVADIYLDNLHLVSRHLRTLDLYGVVLQGAFLDFASCPELENLKMHFCGVFADKISSRSLKHLSLIACRSDLDCPVRICTPGLVSLELVAFSGRTPYLENMPLLETAYVDIREDCEDECLNYDTGVFCGTNNNACENCVPTKKDCNSDCVLLDGISSAIHLQLLSESGKVQCAVLKSFISLCHALFVFHHLHCCWTYAVNRLHMHRHQFKGVLDHYQRLLVLVT
jgi:hypothetical protein